MILIEHLKCLKNIQYKDVTKSQNNATYEKDIISNNGVLVWYGMRVETIPLVHLLTTY